MHARRTRIRETAGYADTILCGVRNVWGRASTGCGEIRDAADPNPKGSKMIKLTRLNNALIVLNSEMIEFIEAIPDTIITLTNGQKIMVRESVEEVIEKVKEYKRSLLFKPFLE